MLGQNAKTLLRKLTGNRANLSIPGTGVHAEIGLLLRSAWELGGNTGRNGLKGADATIRVRGDLPVCGICQGDSNASIAHVASLLNLNSLRVIDDAGQQFVLNAQKRILEAVN